MAKPDNLTDKLLGYAIIALVVVAVVGGLVESLHDDENLIHGEGLLTKGQDVPAFAGFSYPDKKPVTEDDFKGKVVVIDFWDTTCGPCIEKAPEFIELSKTFSNKNVLFVAADLDEDFDDPVADMGKFLKSKDLEGLPVVFTDPKVAVTYRVKATPTLYIVGADGKVRFASVGSQVPERMVRHAIDAALKG